MGLRTTSLKKLAGGRFEAALEDQGRVEGNMTIFKMAKKI